ncbi:NAD-dependent protein deacetylase [Amycolatopsis thermalba]|uniref:NAD-dependent protein deacetylase n=1 Tax=Amycolatopsis thermalba TaxID=944492 RepID=A0ABY4NUL6_9PSEU|nr:MULTISPECIES: NAD-dependent protein deacetylase [Amycolatopsis]UQS23750.1 NAD-dependent protein deacetylase [Amycolatopsis thermalba]
MRTRPTLSWTPAGEPLPRTTSLDDVVRIAGTGGAVVLSGAGLSTESGIPDYRGETGSLRRHTPMTYQEFVAAEHARRRYWARSHLGWRTIARARPNDGHRAVAALRAVGVVGGVITQNVDGLHQAAGTPDVVELHGSLDRVVCLSCRSRTPREELDRRLRAANPDFTATATRVNPDGDADLSDDDVRGFRVVPCRDCAGVLKPDVVFFGENVEPSRVDRCYRLVEQASALLVLGSSLTVMSGLRFVRRAAEAGKPVAIINQGPTRGDKYATVRVDLPLGRALTELVARLTA